MTNDVYWARRIRHQTAAGGQEARGERRDSGRGERKQVDAVHHFWFIIVFLLVSVYSALMQAQNVLKKICVAHIEVVPGVQAVADGGGDMSTPNPAQPRSPPLGQLGSTNNSVRLTCQPG